MSLKLTTLGSSLAASTGAVPGLCRDGARPVSTNRGAAQEAVPGGNHPARSIPWNIGGNRAETAKKGNSCGPWRFN
jgi:hypothetical protein